MSQNYTWPATLAISSNPSVGPNGGPIQPDSTLIAGESPTGTQVPVQVNPAGDLILAPLTPSSVVTANQGAPNTVANAWPVEISDGVNVAGVAPASTAAVTTQPAEVVALSPNTPLPAGTNALGSVTVSAGPVLQAVNIADYGGVATSLGPKLSAASIPVVIASDQSPINMDITDYGGTPTTLGSKNSSSSIPVVIASDQVVPISATALPLPAGASTLAQQVSVQGTTAPGTAATNSELIGGQFNTVLPTLTNGQQAAIQVDSSGRILTSPAGGSATAALQSSVQGTVAAGTAAINSELTGAVFNTTLPTLTNGQQAASQVDSRGRQISVQATPVALTVTNAAITVGTTAVRLTVSGSAPAATRVALVGTPDVASTATFYIGASTVTNSGATRGIEIVAGQSFIANNDAGDYWIVSSTAAQTVTVMEQA